MKRTTALADIFAENGRLTKAIPGYRVRSAQIDMAQAISDAMEANDTLIVEAGTGTGKTFAYLVPAMLWGGKVIISTGTKHLQDQLFAHDIPTIRKVLNVPVSAAILKGRANYVCHYYLERTLQEGQLTSREQVNDLHAIVRFSKTSLSGDKSELSTVPENSAVWSSVTSTRDNCLGSACAHYQNCFLMRARQEAQKADLVVVNHHLFFADVMLRDTGITELLPSANTIIFDEAHQLPKAAALFFGKTISSTQLIELARDIKVEGLLHARDAFDWVQLSSALEYATYDLRLAFPKEPMKSALTQLGEDHSVFSLVQKFRVLLEELIQVLAKQAERAESLEACLRRAEELKQLFKDLFEDHSEQKASVESSTETSADYIAWIETFEHAIQFHRTPLSVAPTFDKQREGPPRAWIFTSATLTVKGDFSHYAEQLGLDAQRSLHLPSPYDYASQGLLYVPKELPFPSDPHFLESYLKAVFPVIKASHGRAFLLCTTLKMIPKLAERLQEILTQHGLDYPLLVQGQGSRTELLRQFRTLENALLIGSQSFWEGVDVVGQALSLVVIDKLPFAPPDDPVLAAQLDVLKRQGKNPFIDHQLPQAVITLKQGAGRLIRSEGDRGVLMICDRRLTDKTYGRQLWQSLPPFKRTRDLETVLEFLKTVEPA